jgi:hypothetical protein
MKPFSLLYNVHGVVLSVEAESPALAQTVDVVLKPYRTNRAASRPFRLQLSHGLPQPSGAEALLPASWQGILPEGQPIAIRAGPSGRSIELKDLAWAWSDVRRRKARIIVDPRRRGPVTDGCVMPVLCEFLGLGGHHVVHAASLFMKRGRRRVGVLLSGPSGAGKTTTSLALAGAGMQLMTDDASFVCSGRGTSGPRVWGLPTRLKVHTRTLALLPHLAGCPRLPGRVGNEYALDPLSLAPEAPRHTAVAGAILFLDPRNDREHRAEPLDKTAALTRLVRENVRAYDPSASGPAGRAFAVLAALVRRCRTWRVSLCPHVESLYDVIAPLVE